MPVHAGASYDGPVFLSLTRHPLPVLYGHTFPFNIGKAVLLRVGGDVAIVDNRDLVGQALSAAELLAKRGIDVRVIDCHTLKPLDEGMVLKGARETGAIVTAENNIIYGGLGSAVAELLVEKYPIPMKRVGVGNTFAESGPYLEVIDKYGLTARHIIRAVSEVLKRKPAGKGTSPAKPIPKPKTNLKKSKVKPTVGKKR